MIRMIRQYPNETAITLFLLAALWSLSATAAAEMAPKPAMDASMYAGGPAIGGYSPVSYFTVGAPERGSADFAVEHEGEVYWLTSAEQVATFEADPAHYAPLFGAFCTYNLSRGQTSSVDPTNYKIVGGQLLLFHRSEAGDALAAWEADPLSEEELLRRATGEFRLLEF